jgi:hypothetical protein
MQSLTFNGQTVEIGGALHLSRIEGLLTGGIEFASYNIPQGNTSAFVSNYSHSRVISVDIGIRGSSLVDFYEKRQALMLALYPPQQSPITFTYTSDDNEVYTFEGYLRTTPNEGQRNGTYQEIGISIFVPSGTINKGNLNSITLEQTGVASGVVLPWTLPVLLGDVSGTAVVVNNGNSYSPLDISIIGPGLDFTIINQTNGQSFKIEGLSLIAGQTIEVSGTDLTVKQAGVSVYQYVASDSQFLQLTPGNNTLAFYVGSGETADTKAIITWYNTYGSI